MNAAISAITGLAGVVVGAVLAARLSRQREKEKQHAELLSNAMVRLMQGVSDVYRYQTRVSSSSPGDGRSSWDEKLVAALAALNTAKSQVILYGPKEMVVDLNTYLQSWSAGELDSAMAAMVALIQAARRSSPSNLDPIPDDLVYEMLYGTDSSTPFAGRGPKT
jgi:hypothetical protein